MESRRTFCDSEFFDLQTVWNTTQPDFSPCFQKTVVQWTPCAFLLLITPLRFYQLSRHNGKSIPVTSLYVMKTVLAMCIALVGVLDIIKTAYEFGSDRYVPTVNLVSPMFPVLTMVLAVILIQRERNHGVKSSGVMCIFWILFLSAELIIFQSKLRSYSYMTDRFHFMTSCCMLTMGIGQFILTFFVDRDEKVKVQVFCPEENSSYLSKITFSWFTETIKQGYKKPLKENDIFELISEDRSENVIAHFDKYWQKELDKQKKLKQQQTNSDLNGKYYETNKPSGSFNTVPQMKVIDKKSEYKANLLFAVIQAYWPHHLLSAGFKIVLNVTQYSTPLVLMWLIKFTENKEYMWRGYLYAVVMLVVKSIRSLLLNNNGDNNQRLARRIMTALRSLIFRKMTKLSNTARKSCTSGELVNLLSVDTNAFADLVHYWNSFWSAPLEIVMTLYMLYQNLGSCVFLGAAIMAVLFPINGYLAKFTREFHTQQMELKDSRIKHMNEILNGIKVLKLYAWEKSFEQQILEIRNKELTIVKKMKCLHAIMSCIWNIAPFLIIIVTFTMYVLMDPNNALNAKKLFVALSLFDILRHQMRELTHVLTNLIPVSVSFMRLQNFLNSEELNPDAILKDPTAENAISIKEGTFTWDREYKATLRDLNLEIPDGSLVAIVGTVGSGKSSLLSAILGEMDKLYGEVNVKGSVAYVAQQAWIQNTSLQNNILFGSTLEQQKYDGIIKACALQSDLDNLPGGDSAEIGEKGINLSGGQKQRVSLARAVYQDADIYLFDDPLSAVDAHVGKHLFQQVLGPNGILKDKTRVMVTHGVSFLSKVDKIVVLVEGEISEVGSYKDLLANDGAFAQFLKSYAAEHKTTKIEPESSSDESSDEEKVDSDDKKIKSLTTSEQKKNKLENLIDEEALETGSVEWSVYVSYLKAVGPVVIAIYAVLFLILQGTEIFSNLWLGRWTGDKPTGNVTVDADVRNWRLKSYGIIGLLSGLTCLLLEVIKMIGTVKATKYLHNMLLRNVFRLPMIFFDTTPIGRIVNRFSKDIEVMDGHIPNLFCTTFRVTIETVSILAVICFNIPMFMFVLIPLVGFYVIIQKFYIATSRQIRRIEQKNRSPVFSHFSESIAGISTIRAFGHQQRFIMESQNRVEELNKSVIANVIAHNWLAVRLDMLANCMVVFSAILLVVIGRDTIRPSVIAWTITSALDITHYMNWMVNISSALETEIVSVERVKEYSELPTEADWEKEEKKPEPQWPEKGVVQFKDFGMRYRKGLDLVIKGISCDIKPGEKIGIVGRTGAGKSSLTMALFRIIEKAQGSIMIDGVDISTLGLHDLRSKLTIIPQDPVLFSGTLRMNLDPFNDCTDEQVWTVLKHAHLYGFVSGLPDRLMHKCVEGGENLSVGQRQLICLARALLRKTKILVLDEATAAVDLEMDDLIQKTIRKEFSDCTILTIAHRLNTITDYTRIMVLDGGRICEFNSPQSLLKDTSGVFYGMAKDAGLVS